MTVSPTAILAASSACRPRKSVSAAVVNLAVGETVTVTTPPCLSTLTKGRQRDCLEQGHWVVKQNPAATFSAILEPKDTDPVSDTVSDTDIKDGTVAAHWHQPHI